MFVDYYHRLRPHQGRENDLLVPTKVTTIRRSRKHWVAIVIDHYSRRVQAIRAFDKQPTGREVRAFRGAAVRKEKAKPRTIVVDKGRQFWCRGFKSWCRRQRIRPRFGAVGRRGSIALVERLIRTLKGEFIAGLIVPRLCPRFQRQLNAFVTWFNGNRPHSALGGRTPNEVYFRRKPANRNARIEPRAKWPRGSPCAEPQARVKGDYGTRLVMHVRFHAGRKQLPVVMLRKAA